MQTFREDGRVGGVFPASAEFLVTVVGLLEEGDGTAPTHQECVEASPPRSLSHSHKKV